MAESPHALHVGGQVLAVDDQPENLALLEDVLTEEGFRVRLASDGQVALDEVGREAPDCIVLDIMMPRLDGFDVCNQLKSRRDTHFIPIVMLTALSGVEDKVRAYELGADDFLNKPVNLHELVARVRSMIKIKRLRDELDTSENIIVSMVEALEGAAPMTAGHSHRVAAWAVRLARRLGLSPPRIELIAKGAVLHDLGKIGLPVTLLQSYRDLTPAQLTEYQQHAIYGERILSPFLSFSSVRALVRHHHERRDGSGYPDGLVGDELDLETEIISLANFYDRSLVRGLSLEATAEQLRTAAARGQFQPDLAEELLAVAGDEEAARELVTAWSDLLPLPCANAAIREALHSILASEGHEIIGHDNEEAVLAAIEDKKPDLVLLDVHLPGRGGIEVSRVIKARPETEFLPVILVTAQHELDARYRGTRVGADDFLFLPINRLELKARVKSLLRLRLYFKDLEEHHSVILSLASALEAKDPYTRGHSERVGVLAAQLGRTLGIAEDSCETLRFAGQLHDVGKIGMPETLLNKNSKLTDEEFETVMKHPLLGERICRPLRTMQAILPLVRHHHERYDGSGYPDRLVGAAIPVGARILGLADAYDALTSERSYRGNFTSTEAIHILTRETDKGRWDPKIFAALAALIRRG